MRYHYGRVPQPNGYRCYIYFTKPLQQLDHWWATCRQHTVGMRFGSMCSDKPFPRYALRRDPIPCRFPVVGGSSFPFPKYPAVGIGVHLRAPHLSEDCQPYVFFGPRLHVTKSPSKERRTCAVVAVGHSFLHGRSRPGPTPLVDAIDNVFTSRDHRHRPQPCWDPNHRPPFRPGMNLARGCLRSAALLPFLRPTNHD